MTQFASRLSSRNKQRHNMACQPQSPSNGFPFVGVTVAFHTDALHPGHLVLMLWHQLLTADEGPTKSWCGLDELSQSLDQLGTADFGESRASVH